MPSGISPERFMAKHQSSQCNGTSWICPKCKQVVYITERLHEYVCKQYQKENQDKKEA
jgi:hypothetical protein